MIAVLVLTGAVPVTGIALVPVCGIVIGGAMTATSLCGRRALDELALRHGEYEAALSLGLRERDAAMLLTLPAAGQPMVPAMDQTALTVGLVTLPGAFVGVLIEVGTRAGRRSSASGSHRVARCGRRSPWWRPPSWCPRSYSPATGGPSDTGRSPANSAPTTFRTRTCCTLGSGSRARSPRWGAVETMARLPGPSAALRTVPAPRAVLQRPPTDGVLAVSGRAADRSAKGYRPAQRARRQSHRTR